MNTNNAFITTLPDFLEIQRSSFCCFLSKGLSEELSNFSVIKDLTNSITLDFFGNDFRIQKPVLDIVETKSRDRTFAIRIYVPVSISKLKHFENFNKDKVYTFIGEIPLMTNRGTFVINGCEPRTMIMIRARSMMSIGLRSKSSLMLPLDLVSQFLEKNQ